MKAMWIALVVTTGCVSADFHSRNGRTFPSVTHQAILINADEYAAVQQAGGVVIGTISSEGQRWHDENDLNDKVEHDAADKGGTHVFRTNQGEDVMTYQHPATVTKDCSRDEDGVSCEKTYQPAYDSEVRRPTAEYQVIRVPRANWASLPEMLQPAP
jgi:hypothetical protein